MPGTHPRQQYYAFAHQALPEIFFADADKLMSVLEGNGEIFLRYLWRKMEEYASVETSKDADQIQVEFSEINGISLALVTMPPPQHTTEAYFLALLHRSDDEPLSRYITLEYSQGLDGKPHTVLG